MTGSSHKLGDRAEASARKSDLVSWLIFFQLSSHLDPLLGVLGNSRALVLEHEVA